MAFESFKKQVWEDALLFDFHENSFVDAITTKPMRVEGTKAIFNNVTGGEIKDYTGTVEYDDVDTASIELVYDKKKYFAINVEDIDAVQAQADVLGQVCADKAAQLVEVQNGIVLAEMVKGVKTANKIGSSVDKKTIATPSEAYDYVVDLGVVLSKAKFPKTNRYLLASDEFVQMMAKDNRFADNYNVLPNGVVSGATVAGFTIIITEDVPKDTVVACHKSATGYGMILDKTEAIRREGSFSDAVRALQVSGVKTLRENGISVLYYEVA